MNEENKPNEVESEPNGEAESAPKKQKKEKEPREHFTLFRKDNRKGKYVSRLSEKELDKLQIKKTVFMYLSAVFFAVNLLLKVEGRTRLSENKELFALFSLYVICELALLVYSVYIMIMGKLGHKIRREIREKDTPKDGLDKHTFRSYEVFNIFHFIMAAAEIAVSCYSFGLYGALNIAAAAASATCSLLSRQILFKANSGNLDYVPDNS